jgi:acyl-CoA thioester hydrolase
LGNEGGKPPSFVLLVKYKNKDFFTNRLLEEAVVKDKLLWETEIEVRYVETDHMGRTASFPYTGLFRNCPGRGCSNILLKSYAAIERRGVFAPIVAFSVDILNPAFYEDKLIVKVMPYDYTGVRLTLSYEITRRETGEPIATGLTTNIFVDEENKPINLRNRYPEIYKNITMRLNISRVYD